MSEDPSYQMRSEEHVRGEVLELPRANLTLVKTVLNPHMETTLRHQ